MLQTTFYLIDCKAVFKLHLDLQLMKDNLNDIIL